MLKRRLWRVRAVLGCPNPNSFPVRSRLRTVRILLGRQILTGNLTGILPRIPLGFGRLPSWFVPFQLFLRRVARASVHEHFAEVRMPFSQLDFFASLS
jgi:hypothetical protein